MSTLLFLISIKNSSAGENFFALAGLAERATRARDRS